MTVVVAALYQFTKVDDCGSLHLALRNLGIAHGIKGTILIAHEGINGTVCATRAAIDALRTFLKEDGRFDNLEYKESWANTTPFYRLKVRIKKEIVTLGVDEVDCIGGAGTYVEPRDWNKLIQDPNVIVIDTRNDYEVAVGTFQGAVDPKFKSFRAFPTYVSEQMHDQQDKKIAMFCTGGIRCEKSAAYLEKMGFKNIHHLKGGILRYLEDVPPQDSLWRGECFVFDQRTAVQHGLDLGEHGKCYGCRMPLAPSDKKSEHYVEGVQCHHCFDHHDDKHYARVRERHRQIMLAKSKNRSHLGDESTVRDLQEG